MKTMLPKVLTLAVGAALLGGCATTPALSRISAAQARLKQQAAASAKAPPALATENAPYVAPKPVRYLAPADAVSVQASGLPLKQALRSILPAGWSLSFESDTQPGQGVDIDLEQLGRNSAIRQVAMAGGDVAVIRPGRRQVVIAKRATYLFRVPTGLLSAQSADLDVSSSSSISGSSGGSSMGGMGGSSIGGSSMGSSSMGGMGSTGGMGTSGGSSGGMNGASFSVTGGSQTSGFLKTLQSLAGPNGSVSLDAATGLVSVTSGAGGLERVTHYIDAYSRAANTKVEIHAAILEVQLDHGLTTGIQWNKVLSNTLGASLSATQPTIGQLISGASTSAFSLTKTGTNLNGVIKALQQVTTVKVITKPWLVASNGTPATINSGTQVPYVGDIQSNVTGLSGTSTTGASLSYANNGIALSFIPQVLGHGWVQMAVVPQLSTIEKFETFTVDGQQMNGPELQQRQAFVRMLMRSGQTVILGGSISQSANQQTSGIPGLSRIPVLGTLFGAYGQGNERTQLVILVRTKVVPAPDINPLVGESL
ncbi:hypothetical protein BI364_07040 [Acidihalobacter yilgarnensis]|uniref:Type II/III secretion system secretin-like domain-containing protein n=1 Tax=Acidihalobacter yilgarnensis TaxID=2819280 RepID=A0A1D8IMQ7_9GAMM|nr:type II and III secretion system protein [Acidihalobacter yilgarnensis]AOU97747.1 hypothetical protein BI364_07040 [Acidihalobacter yilgarnensis]